MKGVALTTMSDMVDPSGLARSADCGWIWATSEAEMFVMERSAGATTHTRACNMAGLGVTESGVAQHETHNC